MYTIERATVDGKIRNGYNFDFGKYISEGINIFAKEWLQFGLFTFVSCIIMLFSAVTIIGSYVVLICTLSGYACVAEKIEKGERVEFNDFFKGYRNFGDKILLGLIYFAFVIVLYIPYLMSMFSMGYFTGEMNHDFNALPIVSLIFSYIFLYGGLLILNSALLFSTYLIHYGNYSATESVKNSFRLYKKNFWLITIFVLVLLILAYMGLFFCLVGFFFTLPILGTSYYALVKETLILAEHSEIDQIGNPAYH